MENTDQMNPLISFVLVAYNQEQYIDRAVVAALEQKYSPLEIILSDDCSSDMTYSRMIAHYKQYTGPHKIIVNRNSQNMGLVSHLNKVCKEIATGSLIVVAAGDDVSLPNRVDTTYSRWKITGKKALAISCSLEMIDDNDVLLGYKLHGETGFDQTPLVDYLAKPVMHGCGAAYQKRLFEFADLRVAPVEDVALFRRAKLLGSVLYVKDILVKCRPTRNSMSRTMNYRKSLERTSSWKKGCALQLREDLACACSQGLITQGINVEVSAFVEREIGESVLLSGLLDHSLCKRISSLMRWKKFYCPRRGELVGAALQIIPQPLRYVVATGLKVVVFSISIIRRCVSGTSCSNNSEGHV